jgi:peptidoglycan/LPS O-acetylase OafA/YrhL
VNQLKKPPVIEQGFQTVLMRFAPLAHDVLLMYSNVNRTIMNPSKRYLTTLTPLRGIAALLVVIFHSNLMAMPFLPPGYTSFVSGGWLWVDFFFILSGFILFYVYGKDFQQGIQRKSYWKYIGARFARVYPLHFVTLIWCSVCTIFVLSLSSGLHPFFKGIFDLKAIPASLVMLQSIHLFDMTPLNTPSWSLSTEWWVYMLFPFIVPLFLKVRTGGRLIVFGLIVSLYCFIRYILNPMGFTGEGNGPTINVSFDYGLLRCIAGFILGMLLYLLYESRFFFGLFKRDLTFLSISFLIILGLHFGLDEFLILLLFPLLILSASFNESGVKRFLDLPALQRLGDWSFSIYMVHVPLIFLLWIYQLKVNPALFGDFIKYVQRPQDYTTGVVVCFALVTFTLLVASLTYRYVEVPARNYLNQRISKKKEETPTLVETP